MYYLYLIKLSQASYDLGQTASYKRPELNSSLMIQLVSLKGLKAPITAVHKRNGGFGRIHVVAIFREAPGQLSQQQATQRVAVSKVCFLVTTKRVEANPWVMLLNSVPKHSTGHWRLARCCLPLTLLRRWHVLKWPSDCRIIGYR